MIDDVKTKYPDYIEVLTANGFKQMYQIDFTDKIATLSDAGYIEFQRPNSLSAISHKGDINEIIGNNIHFHSSRAELIVYKPDTRVGRHVNQETTAKERLSCVTIPVSGYNKCRANKVSLDNPIKLAILLSVYKNTISYVRYSMRVPVHVINHVLNVLKSNTISFRSVRDKQDGYVTIYVDKGVSLNSDFVVKPDWDSGYMESILEEFGKYSDWPKNGEVLYCDTSNDEIIDAIQMIAAINNSRTTITNIDNITKRVAIEVGRNKWIAETVTYKKLKHNGFMYSVVTDNDIFIGRYKNRIFMGYNR